MMINTSSKNINIDIELPRNIDTIIPDYFENKKFKFNILNKLHIVIMNFRSGKIRKLKKTNNFSLLN